MLCVCTKCNNIIPKGKPLIFGKDYLFCSTTCRYNFFNDNPHIENKKCDVDRIPEQTKPIYMPKLPSLVIIPSSKKGDNASQSINPPKKNKDESFFNNIPYPFLYLYDDTFHMIQNIFD